MTYVDTSVAVLLCVDQPASIVARAALAESQIVTWWGTRIECASAVARLHREGAMTDAEEVAARRVLGELAANWDEVVPSDGLREHALRLLRLHPLRAGDACQLAAALTWMQAKPDGARFATGDRQLGRAAQAEGFEVWSPFAPPPG